METSKSDRVFNVLFLCTGNTARSVMAESILRKEGRGRFRSFSAGSQPKGQVNPYAIRVLERAEYPTDGLRSKSWLEFASPDAPVMDFVFTVCDNAAGEACPVWPGQPMTAHWGIEDPAAVDGTDLEKEAAFVKAPRQPAAQFDRQARARYQAARDRPAGRLDVAIERRVNAP
jgi:arsenate reductase